MDKALEKNKPQILWKILAALSLVTGVVLIGINIAEFDIWLDEAYTIGIIKNPFKEMIHLINIDVHPPLYYLIVKFFYMLSPNNLLAQLIVLQLVSVLPNIGTMFLMYKLLCQNKIKKDIALFLTSLLIFWPNILNYSIEMRMYSWAALFIMIAFYSTVQYLQKFKTSWLSGIILGAVLAAYTHYFAAVMAGMIFVYLFVFSIVRKNNKILCQTILSGILFVILFSPWLVIAFYQIKSVSNDFWIPPFTWQTLLSFFIFPFQIELTTLIPRSYSISHYMRILAAVIFIILICYLRKKVKENLVISLGLWVFFSTLIFGTVVSYLVRPIFLDRYLFPALVPLVISLIILITGTKFKGQLFVQILIGLFVLVNGVSLIISTTTHFLKGDSNLSLIESDFLKTAPLVQPDETNLVYSGPVSILSDRLIYDAALSKADKKTDPYKVVTGSFPNGRPLVGSKLHELKKFILIDNPANSKLTELKADGYTVQQQKVILIHRNEVSLYLLSTE